MPQIWPMNWLFLLSLFILTFIFFISAIYFINISVSKINPVLPAENSNPINLNWKW